jgi:hypothetical protein
LNESGFDTAKTNNNNYITHTNSNSSNNSYGRISHQGTSSNSYKPIGIGSENYNFSSTSDINKNPQPNFQNTQPAAQKSTEQKPLVFRTKSPERKVKVDSPVPSSGSGSLFDGSKIGNKNVSNQKAVDVWDSNAWFDEM